MNEKAKEKKEETPKVPKKPSYQATIVKVLTDSKGVAPRDVLLAATGADAKNLSVSVSILRNGKRTKNPVDIKYLRANQTFYMFPIGQKAYDGAVKMAAAAKTKKKAEAAKTKKMAEADPKKEAA